MPLLIRRVCKRFASAIRRMRSRRLQYPIEIDEQEAGAWMSSQIDSLHTADDWFRRADNIRAHIREVTGLSAPPPKPPLRSLSRAGPRNRLYRVDNCAIGVGGFLHNRQPLPTIGSEQPKASVSSSRAGTARAYEVVARPLARPLLARCSDLVCIAGLRGSRRLDLRHGGLG